MIRPLLLAAAVLATAPLATPALSLVSAGQVSGNTLVAPRTLHVFTHRGLADAKLAGGLPLACDVPMRPGLACIPSGAVANVLGLGDRDCGVVNLAELRACLAIAAGLNKRGDALHVWQSTRPPG